MKSLKTILGIVLATATLGGAIAVGAATGFDNETEPIQEAKADYNVTVSSNLSASHTTMRYWFINNQDNFWSGNAKFGIHVWGGSVDAYYLMNDYKNGSGGSGQTFFYIDIPSDTTSFQLIRFSSGAAVGSNKTVWGDTGTLAVSSYKPYYLHWCSGSAYPYVGTLSNSPANNPRPSAWLLSKVVEAYNVCSSSEYNGYGAASQLYTNWISQYDESINGNWDEVTITDYSSGSYSKNGNKYDGLSKNTSYTVHEKWLALASYANINPSTGVSLSRIISAVNNSNISYAIVISVSVVSVCAIGAGYFLLKKKRKVE